MSGPNRAYMYTSLDGFIAGRDDGLEWSPVDDEQMRFALACFSEHEGIVFGRSTYEMVVSYWDMDRTHPSVDPLEVAFADISAEGCSASSYRRRSRERIRWRPPKGTFRRRSQSSRTNHAAICS